MNEKEDYFRISKNGHFHILSDRIPLLWKELLVIPIVTFFVLFILSGILVGLVAGILSAVGYTLYRCTAWIYYSEIIIDEKSGTLTRLKKVLHKTQTKELITDRLDLHRFEYVAIARSGKTKFLLRYRTHKDHELLILKNKTDKKLVETYITEKITSSQ